MSIHFARLLARRLAPVLSVVGALLVGALLPGCASLPPPNAREAVTALDDNADTPLAQVWQRAAADRAPEVNAAVKALPDPRDAFAARVLLARAAKRSLDVQYYIWHDDVTGRLLWHELRLAAERGVRVRLLVDDTNTKGLDPTLAALDGVPNLEVRLANPFAHRRYRVLDLVGDFARVNRRMHNKSFTADNQATIVGGRNVGDEYFGVGTSVEFRDLDVIAFGPIVRKVSASFDDYWNAPTTYRVADLVPPVDPRQAGAILQRIDDTRADPAAARYLQAVARTPLVTGLVEGRIELEWLQARLVADPASKLAATSARANLASQLVSTIGEANESFNLISPYFVPGSGGTDHLVDLARRGVTVRVLTNSLAATDVAAVHAGYAKRRKALLAGGVQLFELKPDATTPPAANHDGKLGGSSDASLHAKTFAIDGQQVFVGSFNFDPRSVALNTELGLVMHSPALAQAMAQAFEQTIPAGAYEVRLDAAGALVWIERTPAGERRLASEPDSGPLKLLAVGLLSLLPIEWLL
ncbi:MAG: phospholipase D family protein [Burkholderiaceae bacterium]|jgi:putative cardiolipin synthase|nr:phospholipase D family protein [Burkholderiaceae bacterium]